MQHDVIGIDLVCLLFPKARTRPSLALPLATRRISQVAAEGRTESSTEMNIACRRAFLWPFSPRASSALATASPRLGRPANPPVQDLGRAFSAYQPLQQQEQDGKDGSPDAKAKRLNQKGVDDFEKELSETWARDKQQKRPWHRAGSEAEPPSASSDPTNGDKTKGERNEPGLVLCCDLQCLPT